MSVDVPCFHGQSDTIAALSSFQLAHQQSFGYFDDIPDYAWREAQNIHAKMFPNHFSKDLLRYSNSINDKGKIDKLRRSNWWNGENFHEEFHCLLAQRIPETGEADGPKWVCDPHRLRRKKDCLVYSFGSNGKIEFEEGIRHIVGPHCEIHTFDMVSTNKRNGNFAERLKGYATFHQWGLGTDEQAATKPSMYKTLAQTMEILNHTGRTIDIFKIDCEWCEWTTYQQWLQTDIRQLLVETHNGPMPEGRNFFYTLHDAGYVIFSKEANFQNAAGGVEFGFIKLSTDFFVNATLYSRQ